MNKKSKILPRGNWVLIKPEDTQTLESESGIVIPSNVEQEQKAIGTVIEVGKFIDDIEKGEKVIYGVYAGEKISINNSNKVDYLLLKDEDIIAFVKE